jgi:hypothetical protein
VTPLWHRPVSAVRIYSVPSVTILIAELIAKHDVNDGKDLEGGKPKRLVAASAATPNPLPEQIQVSRVIEKQGSLTHTRFAGALLIEIIDTGLYPSFSRFSNSECIPVLRDWLGQTRSGILLF